MRGRIVAREGGRLTRRGRCWQHAASFASRSRTALSDRPQNRRRRGWRLSPRCEGPAGVDPRHLARGDGSNGADTDPVEATADITVTVSDVGFTAFDATTLAEDFDEDRHSRVATLDAGDPVAHWSLSGADADWFRIAGGVLRFRSQASGGPPDYESPGDTGTDNTYVVMVTAEEDPNDADTTDASSVTV